MGFYCNGDQKQHINLSHNTWMVIRDDMSDFSFGKRTITLSGFLNQIFTNFNQSSFASISLRKDEEKERLESLFGNKKNIKELVKIYLNDYEEKLCEKMNSFPKGRAEKFRINDYNMCLLEESLQDEYYEGSIGLYLKAIYEDYASKPNYEREQIYFKEVIDKINNAILTKKKIRISLLKKTNSTTNENYSRTFYLTPYKIIQDKSNNFNYVVGYTTEIDKDNTPKEKIISSFRISRIDTIRIMESMKGFISKDDKEKIEEKIQKNTVQFLAGEILDIKVKFTNKGLELFHNQLYMRPNDYEKIDDNTYVFHCTSIQAMNYFFKIGKHVEIISPIEVRDNFIRRYKEALNKYIKEVD